MNRFSAAIFPSFVIVFSLTAACAADEPREAAGRSYKLAFSGKDDCVVIPRLRYDGSHPITLEALVTPQARDDDPVRSCVIGNVELSGVAIHYKPSGWLFHVNDGRKENGGYASAVSDDEPVLGEQVHVAAVYDGTNVRIFVDGQLQADSDATVNPHKASVLDFMVGADPNAQNKPHQFFKGTIDEVRISKVVRYNKDFTPHKGKFVTDADTLVLYHFDEGEGQIARDVSGNGRDGDVRGATWVPEAKATTEGKVTGIVVLNGKPLATGKITFVEANGQLAGAKITEGKFAFDKIQTGKFLVVIEGKDVPKKFASRETSFITVKIRAGANTMNFELTE